MLQITNDKRESIVLFIFVFLKKKDGTLILLITFTYSKEILHNFAHDVVFSKGLGQQIRWSKRLISRNYHGYNIPMQIEHHNLFFKGRATQEITQIRSFIKLNTKSV